MRRQSSHTLQKQVAISTHMRCFSATCTSYWWTQPPPSKSTLCLNSLLSFYCSHFLSSWWIPPWPKYSSMTQDASTSELGADDLLQFFFLCRYLFCSSFFGEDAIFNEIFAGIVGLPSCIHFSASTLGCNLSEWWARNDHTWSMLRLLKCDHCCLQHRTLCSNRGAYDCSNA